MLFTNILRRNVQLSRWKTYVDALLPETQGEIISMSQQRVFRISYADFSTLFSQQLKGAGGVIGRRDAAASFAMRHTIPPIGDQPSDGQLAARFLCFSTFLFLYPHAMIQLSPHSQYQLVAFLHTRLPPINLQNRTTNSWLN